MNLPKNKLIGYILFVLGIGTVVGMMNTVVVVTTHMAETGTMEILFPFIYEMTGGISFAILLPVMLYVYISYPLTKRYFVLRLLMYILIAVPLGIIHTYIMCYSRQVIFNMSGFGEYNYGIMKYRLIMEYVKMCLGFATAYAVYYLIKTLKEKEEEKLRRSRLEENLAKAKLESLKSQLNPHFLFNTLNMISSVMYEDIAAADKMIANLSELLRESFKTSGHGMHKMSREIELLKIYKEIMSARFQDKLEMNITIANELLECRVPMLLLQPIVENSVKHCLNNSGKILIEIKVHEENNRLYFTVTDNGPGINKSKEEVLNSGVGLSNTIERMNNLYKNDYEFDWSNIIGRQAESDNPGLKVTVSIPLQVTNNE